MYWICLQGFSSLYKYGEKARDLEIVRLFYREHAQYRKEKMGSFLLSFKCVKWKTIYKIESKYESIYLNISIFAFMYKFQKYWAKNESNTEYFF